jgi:hypothetical protein
MDILEYLKRLHDDALRLLPRIKFDKHHALHFALLSLYGSLIELVGCILILMDNRGRLGVPSVFRTFLETYVEFHNLVRDPKYGYYIDANDAKEWLRVLKAARDTRNPYLSGLTALPNLPEIIAKTEDELLNLKTRGFEPLSIRARFQRADMLDEYESFYNFLCTEAHSNKRALISRHTELGAGDYDLVVYKNGPDAEYLEYLDSVAGLLVSATVSIHSKFETDAIEETDSFRMALDAVREMYKEEA